MGTTYQQRILDSTDLPLSLPQKGASSKVQNNSHSLHGHVNPSSQDPMPKMPFDRYINSRNQIRLGIWKYPIPNAQFHVRSGNNRQHIEKPFYIWSHHMTYGNAMWSLNNDLLLMKMLHVGAQWYRFLSWSVKVGRKGYNFPHSWTEMKPSQNT